MSRYNAPQSPETESEPGSRGRVLRNHLGITSVGAMDRAEATAFEQIQEAYSHQITPQTRFTADLLCEMHRKWLGRIYPWAGKYRQVNVSKGGFTWPPCQLVEQNMRALERGVLHRHTPCLPGELGVVVGRLAEVHAELLLVHPFRDGNGRLARWLADLMAAQAGLPPPLYPFTSRAACPGRERYFRCVQAGYIGDYAALGRFFEEAITRRLGLLE